MVGYGKRRRYSKKRYGKKRYGKMRYRKMGKSKSKLYRQGGNFAMASSKASPELKSLDLLMFNGGGPVAAGATTAGSFAQTQSSTQPQKAACENFALQFSAAAGYGFLVTGVSNGNCMLMNSLGVGGNINQRIGRKVTMKSIKMDMLLRAACAAPQLNALVGTQPGNPTPTYPMAIRLMIVYDRQTNGAAPQYADVLTSPGCAGIQGAVQQVQICSSNNLNNRSRFLTIFDKTYYLGTQDKTVVPISIYKKLNLPVIYSNNLTTSAYDVSCIATGGLFFLAISDNNTAVVANAAYGTMPAPWAEMVSTRMRFIDT